MGLPTLTEYLSNWTLEGRTRGQVADTVLALAETSVRLSELAGRGALSGKLGRVVARAGENDEQKEIDLLANNMIFEALKPVAVAALASEIGGAHSAPEQCSPLGCDRSARRVVQCRCQRLIRYDILGAAAPSVIDRRSCLSTPRLASARSGLLRLRTPDSAGADHRPRHSCVHARSGNANLLHDLAENVAIPAEANEYAINASNARHWDDPVRMYIHDCENGANGPRGQDFNMRWTGSPVADIYRILVRGGIYLYPGDRRKGFQQGRIRLIYEANPISWIVEQAGGRATTGKERVLDVIPTSLHQKTPLICGSRDEVDRVMRIYSGQEFKSERSPLFGRRGLFRALP